MKTKKAKTVAEGRKPHFYWQDFENVKTELESLVKKLGHFPSQTELNENGYHGLLDAIHKYYHGLVKVGKKLGYEPRQDQVAKGTWKSLDYTLNQAKKVTREEGTGKLPQSRELNRIGYSSLVRAIKAYHGGFHKFRKLLGEKKIKQEYGKWQNLEFALNEARMMMKKQDITSLPSSRELIDLGYSSLAHSIDRYHGGFRKFRKSLGQEQRKVKDGTFQNKSYITKEIKRIMREKGCKDIPGSDKFREWGYGSLLNAIYKYHGGIRRVRELMGQKQIRLEGGSWKNLDFALGEARKYLDGHQEYSELPSFDVLRKTGYGSLATAITRYHGGYEEFRQQLDNHMGRRSSDAQLKSLLEKYAGE